MPGIHEGKVVIVTGGAGGLGLAVTTKFLEEGAKVVATDIQQDLLDALPSKVDASYKDRLLPMNVNSADDVGFKKALDDIVAKWGRLDVLVNNAGVNDRMDPVGDCPRDMWDRNFLVNVTGPYITMQASVNQMLKQEPAGGVILNVISAAGIAGHRSGKLSLSLSFKMENSGVGLQ
jgi:NAD(P)-dependent dehydrogenase (short-subunit alcohol dehydrogenase family)